MDVIEKMLGDRGIINHSCENSEEYKLRLYHAARFVIKVALKYLPPKQRRIFYSVWCKSDGKRSKGVFGFSRKLGKSHFTNYINYRKAMENLKFIFEKSGYGKYLIMYIKEGQ